MKFSVLTLAALALAVTATPVTLNFVDGEAPPLEKRASETVYLSNCNILGTPVYSQINVRYPPFPSLFSLSSYPPISYRNPPTKRNPQYYSNGANSQNGEQPDDTCYYPLSGYVNWEGNVVSCSFSGGATFTSHIDTDAQSRALYTYAGYVSSVSVEGHANEYYVGNKPLS